ncbi:MAG: glycosyltransferase [Armatimonadetes bacterium]|nr:glycosyltransferase [Armatimonadota bacterium]
MRVVALLATYNEERFITGCLDHLFHQGVEVYLLDNCSTDGTRAIAERHLGRGVIGIETFPRYGTLDLRAILEREEHLAATLPGAWMMHVDADERHLPPRSHGTLAEAFEDVERQGDNAVNFMEFTFVPTQEHPDHDHPDFQRTMRWYYPFLPFSPHLVRAWKKQPSAMELAWSAGHQVRFPGLRIYPQAFPMRHYLFLSVPHAARKYAHRNYDPRAVEAGWHGWRVKVRSELIRLPAETDLRMYVSDDHLDSSHPRTRHCLDLG